MISGSTTLLKLCNILIHSSQPKKKKKKKKKKQTPEEMNSFFT